jgi:glycosyltransferase involved in cell wall biosynthesis
MMPAMPHISSLDNGSHYPTFLASQDNLNSAGKGNHLPRRPFDIVHLAHTTFPEDPRPRREAMIAAETGARVAVVVLNGGRDKRRVSRYGPLTIIRLEGARRRGSAGGYLKEYLDFLVRARRLLREHARFRGARVFHVHTLPDFLIAATRAARRSGARVILDLHEVFPEFTRSKFAGWQGALGEPVARVVERWSRRQADALLTVNHAVAERLHSRPAKANERVLVVHNFADPAEFGEPRLTDGEIRGAIRLVYHGTLTPLYGLDLAVDGVARARERGLQVQLDIYGDGPSRESLETQIGRLAAADFIRLRGTAPHHELRELLSRYDAGLVPTRLDGMTQLSLSTKLLEYVHLGIPLLAPSIPTYLRYFPDETAWYFAPNSSEAITGALLRFAAASPEERVHRARLAQAASTRELDPARDAAQLRNLYRELLQDR